MRDNDCIDQLHCKAWIDFNKETKIFCTVFSSEDDYDKNSVASPSMDKEREGPTVLPVLAIGTFDLNKMFDMLVGCHCHNKYCGINE